MATKNTVPEEANKDSFITIVGNFIKEVFTSFYNENKDELKDLLKEFANLVIEKFKSHLGKK